MYTIVLRSYCQFFKSSEQGCGSLWGIKYDVRPHAHSLNKAVTVEHRNFNTTLLPILPCQTVTHIGPHPNLVPQMARQGFYLKVGHFSLTRQREALTWLKDGLNNLIPSE